MLHGQCKGCARTTWLNDNWYCYKCDNNLKENQMNKYEYKIEFESDFKDLYRVLNVINNILANSELNEYATNIKPTFTILKGDNDDI